MAGRLIKDHSFFAGRASEGSVFPKGVHHKMEKSAEGAGKVSKYEDTTEAIHGVQEAAKAKVNAHKQKDGYFH